MCEITVRQRPLSCPMAARPAATSFQSPAEIRSSVRLPKVETDPAFETQVVPATEGLMPVFLAVKTLWTWTYANDEAYRARREATA